MLNTVRIVVVSAFLFVCAPLCLCGCMAVWLCDCVTVWLCGCAVVGLYVYVS